MSLVVIAACVLLTIVSIVAAHLATRADSRAQDARDTCFAVLDVVRDYAKRLGVTPTQPAGGAPYRMIGAASDATVTTVPSSLSSMTMYVASMDEGSDGKVDLVLSKYQASQIHERKMESIDRKFSIECTRTVAPMPGEEVEVIIRRKTA